jgi:hypothetical protein
MSPVVARRHSPIGVTNLLVDFSHHHVDAHLTLCPRYLDLGQRINFLVNIWLLHDTHPKIYGCYDRFW